MTKLFETHRKKEVEAYSNIDVIVMNCFSTEYYKDTDPQAI